MQAEQDRQAHRSRQERHGNDKSDDHEAVTPAHAVAALRGTVVLPEHPWVLVP
jgi:hypothetical protein